MVMHEGGQASKPSSGAADFAAASVVNADEASRGRRMNLASEGFDIRQRPGGRISAAGEHHHIGLADRLARPRRSFTTAEVNHQRRDLFDLVEPISDLGCIQRPSGKHCVDTGGIDDLGTGRGKPIKQRAIISDWRRLASALDERHRPCLWRGANRGETRRLLGQPPRERREQGLDDGRGVLRKFLVSCARQHEHAGVSDRNHVGGARDICEKADFADQFAGTEFGDRCRMVGSTYSKRTVQHHE